jgi:hypothetical protein
LPRPVQIEETARIFKKGFRKKSTEDKDKVREALRQMTVDLEHPSLRAKPLTGGKGVWEAHASRSVVMTFEFINGNHVRMRACCNHDIYARQG